MSSITNCSCDMLECLAWRFWYCGLKYLMRNKNPLFWKSARVTCVFSSELNFKIAWTCNNTRSIVCVFACNAHISLLLFVYFEDGKWVTCLNYPFSGLHASVPRNWIVWETLWLKTNKRQFWKMAAEQGRTQWNGRSDATARDPRSSPCTGLKVHKPYNPIWQEQT